MSEGEWRNPTEKELTLIEQGYGSFDPEFFGKSIYQQKQEDGSFKYLILELE